MRAEALVLRSELEVGEPPVAIATLEEALAEASGVPSLEASIRWRLADIGRFSRDRPWTEQHARAALQLAGPDAALKASSLQILARLALEHGDANALELAEEARRIGASLSDRRQAKPAAWAVGGILTHTGALDQARQCLERDLVEWGDDELMRSELLWYLALAEFWAGRWTVAARHADEIVEIASRYGVSLPTDHYVPALLALHRGKPAIAADHCRQALERTGPKEFPFISATLAISDLWTGNQAAAMTGLKTVERAADARGWLEPSLRWWRAEYAEGLVQAGRVADAEQLVAIWEGDAIRLRRDRVIAAATRCRGLIALARGEARAAESLLEDAAARHGSAGDPFGRARAQLALGLVRRRLRQKRGARVALDAARVEFEALGAMSWAQTAREELSRIGGRTRIEGLSASERSVAKLAALGQTNREIARTLFLSERTVASHLTHAYAKLGIRSRTEPARRDLQLPTP